MSLAWLRRPLLLAHTCNHFILLALFAGLLVGTHSLKAQTAALPEAGNGWPTYGGDAGGSRYSASSQINKDNVSQLKVAWIFHTGKVREGSLETTPILFKGSLYLTSPTDHVYSIDPTTGQQRWTFDPEIDKTQSPILITSRGVASWSGARSTSATSSAQCTDRIFLGTLDARLIALDAGTGELCADFGVRGSVDLTQNVDYRRGDDYRVTSPPTVIGDVVVVGSGIGDNERVDVELGDVRGFDVRSGKLLWTWEPLPWAKGQRLRTGGGNTWGVIAADLEHGLIYLPTSSPSPDHYGGLRPGDNRDADSIVALDGKTGRKVWSFQVVHHNVWDYDIAAEPLLFTFRGKIPAVAVATKMGLLFVFNRLTGEPLYPIHERPVPQSDVPGETTSPTQPFPDLPPLAPITLDMSRQLGATSADDAACREIMAELRYDGIYSPPSLRGTVIFPGPIGGVNWGSAAFDPASGTLYANTNRIPYIITLHKRSFFAYPERPFLAETRREQFLVRVGLVVALMLLVWASISWRGLNPAWYGAVALLIVLVLLATSTRLNTSLHNKLSQNHWHTKGVLLAKHFGKEYGPNAGTQYDWFREPLASPDYPCSPTPWGAVSALNLNTGKTAWQTPLGTEIPGIHTGTFNVGGPIVTAGGLVFTTASQEPFLRAFDSTTGQEIWTEPIPVPSQATPMTYTINGKQYLVIADGGHTSFGTKISDAIIAFSLP
jgi:quinoprotein glucose dehydrogenase